MFGQYLSCTKCDSEMRIVAAGVHNSLVLRSVDGAIEFGNGKSIHIDSNSYGLVAMTKISNQSRCPSGGPDFETQLL